MIKEEANSYSKEEIKEAVSHILKGALATFPNLKQADLARFADRSPSNIKRAIDKESLLSPEAIVRIIAKSYGFKTASALKNFCSKKMELLYYLMDEIKVYFEKPTDENKKAARVVLRSTNHQKLHTFLSQEKCIRESDLLSSFNFNVSEILEEFEDAKIINRDSSGIVVCLLEDIHYGFDDRLNFLKLGVDNITPKKVEDRLAVLGGISYMTTIEDAVEIGKKVDEFRSYISKSKAKALKAKSEKRVLLNVGIYATVETDFPNQEMN